MNVLEVVCQTMRLVGRETSADNVENGTPTEEDLRLKRMLITYLNAVLDELARGYFPLDTEEKMQSDNGIYPFEDFGEAPSKINRVLSGNNPIGWHICPNYLYADAKEITVFYEYLPPVLEEGDEYMYPNFAVGERLVEYGMAAEYFLVVGDGAGYTAWEEKYRNEIESLLSRTSSLKGRIPPRRWV